MTFLRSIFGFRDDRKELDELRARLEESDKKIEKLIEMFNILATFDEQMANDIRRVASHVALMEISIAGKKKVGTLLPMKKSNDDDIIN